MEKHKNLFYPSSFPCIPYLFLCYFLGNVINKYHSKDISSDKKKYFYSKFSLHHQETIDDITVFKRLFNECFSLGCVKFKFGEPHMAKGVLKDHESTKYSDFLCLQL